MNVYLTQKVSSTKKMAVAEVTGATCLAHAERVLESNGYKISWPMTKLQWAVDQKIKEKEIIIGKPALKAGEKLITDMNEGRYFIEY